MSFAYPSKRSSAVMSAVISVELECVVIWKNPDIRSEVEDTLLFPEKVQNFVITEQGSLTGYTDRLHPLVMHVDADASFAFGNNSKGEAHWRVECSVSPAASYQLKTLYTWREIAEFVQYGRSAIEAVPGGTSSLRCRLWQCHRSVLNMESRNSFYRRTSS